MRDANGQALSYVYYENEPGRLLLTVLGGLAEFERHLILARTDEGRKRAKARGVKFRRKGVDGDRARLCGEPFDHIEAPGWSST
jgi:DNA invertase Pin-like site-specific DNA recombinase